MKKYVNQIVGSKAFDITVLWAIILCSLMLGIETYYLEKLPVFHVLDIFFTSLFTLEIILRMINAGSLTSFFTICTVNRDYHYTDRRFLDPTEDGFWNWFDTLIVVFSWLGVYNEFVQHPEFLIVGRLFRTLRILRLLEISNELKAVEKKIISIIPTIFSFFLLIGLLMYIYAVVGVYLFDHKVTDFGDFSNIMAGFLTLFKLLTLDDWSNIMKSFTNGSFEWFKQMYFVSFIILTAIISFNVFIAVLTSQVYEKMRKDRDIRIQEFSEHIDEEIDQSEQELLKQMNAMMTEIKSLKGEIKSLKE